ncbi:MAG TPA: PAS domain-containing protein [Verrucomicrobiae bacterium]|nr:PAS domain-containing protein [Verrucomicrobiae bacterium]
MNRPSHNHLRARLALVVLLAVVPSLGLIYYIARSQRAAAIASAREDVDRLARLMASNNTRVIEGARQLLATLARLPEVRSGDSTRCTAVLKSLIGEYTFFANLGVAAPDGQVMASAVETKKPLSLNTSSWFQQVTTNQEFAVGEYQSTAYIGYPLVNADNHLSRILFVSLDLGYLTRQMSLALPLKGATLSVVDRDGTVLGVTSSGGVEYRVGSMVPEAAQIKAVARYRGRGGDEMFDPAGVERLYAFYPVGGKRAGVDLYVTASLPTDIALAGANADLKRNLIALGVVALLALAAAWYGGESIFLRRANDDLERRVKERTHELEHEQFLMRTLLENIPDSIYFKDRDGRFLRSSRAQAKRFGLSDPSQTIGKTDFDFFTKEHAKEAFTDEQQIIETGQPLVDIEENSTLADGTERWVSTSKMPLRDQRGNVVGTFGISREITERKRAEQALAKDRSVLRTLTDNLPDIVFIKDTKGRYVFDNAAHRAFLQISSVEDLAGKTVFDLYPKDLAERLHADDNAILAAGMPVLHREEELTDRKGRKVRVLASKIPYRDEQRRVAGLVCMFHLLDGEN